jgi:hypothetical protein
MYLLAWKWTWNGTRGQASSLIPISDRIGRGFTSAAEKEVSFLFIHIQITFLSSDVNYDVK